MRSLSFLITCLSFLVIGAGCSYDSNTTDDENPDNSSENRDLKETLDTQNGDKSKDLDEPIDSENQDVNPELGKDSDSIDTDSNSDSAEGEPFVTTWKTDNEGPGDDRTIKIKVKPPRLQNDPEADYDVDWDDDGEYEQKGLTEAVTHTFDEAGTYTIRMRGKIPNFRAAKIDLGSAYTPASITEENGKLLAVEQWGDIDWKDFTWSFAGCYNLRIRASDIPDLSKVRNLTAMFWKAESLKEANGKLGDWDTGQIKAMSSMFKGAAKFNADIGGWDTSQVEFMGAMFEGADSFNRDIGAWDTSSVESMSSMFKDADAFNQDIGDWDTSNVQDMSAMFEDAVSFNGNIANWDTSRVVDMADMFEGAKNFNRDIGNWDTGNVDDMSDMFLETDKFNQDIQDWDTSQVELMYRMFVNAKGFNQSLGGFNINNAAVSRFLSGAGLSVQNYDSTLDGWASGSVPEDKFVGVEGLEYCEAEEARQKLIKEHDWDIVGDKKNCSE